MKQRDKENEKARKRVRKCKEKEKEKRGKQIEKSSDFGKRKRGEEKSKDGFAKDATVQWLKQLTKKDNYIKRRKRKKDRKKEIRKWLLRCVKMIQKLREKGKYRIPTKLHKNCNNRQRQIICFLLLKMSF